MNALLLCAALLAAALTPAQRQAQPPAAPSKRDTIYVAVPPTANVQAPSDTPTIVLGIAGVLLLLAQLWIMKRQTDLMVRQTALGEQQDELRRIEASHTFFRIAHDIAIELRKANGLPGALISANEDLHARLLVRPSRSSPSTSGGLASSAASSVGPPMIALARFSGIVHSFLNGWSLPSSYFQRSSDGMSSFASSRLLPTCSRSRWIWYQRCAPCLPVDRL